MPTPSSKYLGSRKSPGMSIDSYVLRPGEGRAIDLGAFIMTVKASAEATSGGFTLLEAAEPPEFGPPMHIHRDAAEAFYILRGEYVIFIDDHGDETPVADVPGDSGQDVPGDSRTETDARAATDAGPRRGIAGATGRPP